MTDTTDHRHLWHNPVNDRGARIGPTSCEVCGIEPAPVTCGVCGERVDETIIKHGSLRKGLHRVEVK